MAVQGNGSGRLAKLNNIAAGTKKRDLFIIGPHTLHMFAFLSLSTVVHRLEGRHGGI